MTISQNKCFALSVLIVSFVLLSSGSIVFAADVMPTFTEDDFADCKITGFEYDYSTQSQDENHSGTFVSYNGDRLEFWLDFYKNADDAKTNFQTYRDSHIKDVDLLKNLPCITILEADFTDTESTLISYGKTYSCTMEEYYGVKFALLYADNYVSYGEFGARAADFSEQQVRDALAQMKDCIIKVINSKDRKFWGKVTNAWGEKLPGMVVKLTYGDKEYEATTDENGTYRIPFEGTFGRKAQLSFLMQCYDAEEDRVLFTLNTDYKTDTPYQFDQNFIVKDENDLKHDFEVMNDLKGTEYMGYVYYKLIEAMAVYVQEFGEEEFASKIQEVIIRIYAADRNSFYEDDKNSIVISDRHTKYKDHETLFSLFRPAELEFHEYSHHVMKCYYGKLPAAPADSIVPEINHDGYINPSTADSFVEGFAIFMAQIIWKKRGYEEPGVDSMFGSLEVNTRAWDGNHEDIAVAGIFWDLYDGVDAADNDAVQLTLQEIWGVLKANKKNMYEVYQKFVNDFPDKKPGIDQIFINHGFFADTDKGNGTYDPGEPYRGSIANNDYFFVDLANPMVWDNKKKDGQELTEKETIGQATNYQRPGRYFPPPKPNQFIKTNSAYPFYKTTVTFPQQPSLNYEIFSEQEDGLIPVSIPPDTYQATITVEGYGEGVTTAAPLAFTNSDYVAKYASTIEQGYYTEHDFQITGTAPPRPVTDPALTNPGQNKCLASKLLGKHDNRLNTLRRFRDEVLVKSSIGKQLVKIYYEKSTTVIEALESHEFCRKIAAALLGKIIPVIEMTLT